MYQRLALCILLILASEGHAHPWRPNAADREDCAEKGGKYKQIGFGEWVCVIPYPDAGNVCTDDSQCLGGCIFEYGSGGPEPKRGDRSKGICERTNEARGCFSHIKKGRVADDAFCID